MRCRRDLVGRNPHIDGLGGLRLALPRIPARGDCPTRAVSHAAARLSASRAILVRGVEHGCNWLFCGVRRIAPIADGTIGGGDHQGLNKWQVTVADIGKIRA